MAARRAPPKAREMDFGNVGVAGRRTGVTLELGKLDEHGMEEIDGMFSSPEKTPVRAMTNGFGNETIMNSEDMETGGSSSMPEPLDMLSARRGRNSYIPPPRSRSPIKTNLSGSPRRTPGIRSSPIPRSDERSSPISRTAAKRAFDISEARIGKSPLNQVRSTSIPIELESSAVKEREQAEIELDDPTADFSDDGNYLVEQAGEDSGEEIHEQIEEEIEEEVEEEIQEEIEEESRFIEQDDVDGSSDRDAHDKSAQDETHTTDESRTDMDDHETNISPPVIMKGARGRKRKNEGQSNPSPTNDQPGPKKRGRKPKALQTEAQPVDQGEDSRPTKRTKTAAKTPYTTDLKLSAQQEKELNHVIENITKRDGPLQKKRSLHILRKENPSDESVRHTRSGRISVKPLAYWRNEKCVYGSEEAEAGQRFPLTTIKEIIRIDEPPPDYKKTGKKLSKKKAQTKRDRDESSDDDADLAEPWEKDKGVLFGPVKTWDPEQQAATDQEELMDVAYAPVAIRTHEVKGSMFRFAKVLSTPFLGSGFVEMPPGAIKKQKNSKRMHMVFFVYQGRVNVDVSGLEFSAGKGCVFQVPRGNNYHFANIHDKPAALFFTQGCIPLDPDGNVDTGAPAPPLPDPAHQVSNEENDVETPKTTEKESNQPEDIEPEQAQSEGAQQQEQRRPTSSGKAAAGVNKGKKKRGRPKQKA